jgi:hypothetical protein
MPKTSIDKDRRFHSQEDDVSFDSTLISSYEVVFSESVTRSVQQRSYRKFKPGVRPTVSFHCRYSGGIRRVRVR